MKLVHSIAKRNDKATKSWKREWGGLNWVHMVRPKKGTKQPCKYN